MIPNNQNNLKTRQILIIISYIIIAMIKKKSFSPKQSRNRPVSPTKIK
jgi:hypothetical protein